MFSLRQCLLYPRLASNSLYKGDGLELLTLQPLLPVGGMIGYVSSSPSPLPLSFLLSLFSLTLPSPHHRVLCPFSCVDVHLVPLRQALSLALTLTAAAELVSPETPESAYLHPPTLGLHMQVPVSSWLLQQGLLPTESHTQPLTCMFVHTLSTPSASVWHL